MSSLTGPEILAQLDQGNIRIAPFDKQFVTSDGVDLHLGDELLFYPRHRKRAVNLHHALDSLSPPEPVVVRMEEHRGRKCWVLRPGVLYLGATKERTYARCFVPRVTGRSTTGRLGVSIHATAGEGDHGFDGHWTLEISVVEPVLIYPGQRIAQIRFTTLHGELAPYGSHDISGNYQKQGSKPVGARPLT